MQSANRLQKALLSSTPTFGAWQMLPGTQLSRLLARSSPALDWQLLDTEHGALSDSAMHESVAAVAACGVSPVVRVADAQHWMLKRALDAGAHGVIVPLLQSASDAEKVVDWCKFPPKGTRGFGSPFAMEAFVDAKGKVPSAVQYLQEANGAVVVAVQIETRGALDDVEAIAAVDGVDVLFVGPFDLGNNIGHPILGAKWDEELVAAVERIRVAAKGAGKKVGIYCGSGEQAREFADKGFDMVSAATDAHVVSKAFGQALDAARGSYVHAGVQGIKQGIGKMTTSS
ncbi:hypothetical protein MBLNU230_g1048t1 [Neophaeotheca triangularis]